MSIKQQANKFLFKLLVFKICEYENFSVKKVLIRIVSIIQILCIGGLAFRGESELLRPSSVGNYLGILKLLSQSDTFLAEHICKHRK